MATSILEAFIVTFGIDDSGYKSGAAEVDRTTKRTRDEVKKTFSGIEDQGKNLGQAFRTVRNEAIGLFLAFTGASSLTGFITGMLNTTAAADRMGQTIGMSTGRVVAWRQAMKEIGGSPGSADAALQAMERATQNYRLTGSSGMDADLLGLGVNRGDLLNKDPGQLLIQMAKARDKMSGPEFAARLGRAGMPQEMTYFLQQGGDKVAKLISAYEKNSGVYEKQASEAEKLQKTLADLNMNLMQALVPPVTKIAELLNRLLSHFGMGVTDGAPRTLVAKDPTGSGLFNVYAGDKTGDDPITKYLMSKGLSADQAFGVRAGIEAESNGNPNAVNPDSGAYGIGQWLGARKKALFAKYGPRPNMQQQLDFLLSELNGGDHGGKSVLAQNEASHVLWAYVHKFMRPGVLGSIGDMGRGWKYLASHRMPAAGHVTIHKIEVNGAGKNGHQIAREIQHGLKKRGLVARADGGVAP